uniref:SDR family NAD(P)-dependent oxidoreductase n=1 Tax=Rhodococcus qingshengii TaxID=334542 RepID=UPI001C4E0B43|nr:SDR family NAD(P)-dependent oxidoreductase [Rhodococcus qingshengii]
MLDFNFAGTAVVTGAAGGIGRALVTLLAKHGSDIVLVDRDEMGLAQAVDELDAAYPRSTFTPYVVDLADRDETRLLGEVIADAHPDVRLLVNNAGVALSGTFDQYSEGDVDWLLSVNLAAPIVLVRALLPVLRRNPGAHIANVSSVFGLVAPARNVAYATSKFGIRGFTESLRAELAPEGIGVTCVHPGGIKTNIARDSRIGSVMTPQQHAAAAKDNIEFDKVLTITADEAARTIFDGIRRRRARVLIGATAKIPDLIARLVPSHYHSVVDAIEYATAWFSARTDNATEGNYDRARR